MPLKSLKSQNYYDILGVARYASPEEIRSAYEISRHTFQENSLATYSLFSDQENQEILALIAKAFETLFNPETRRAYDAQLGSVEGEPPPRRPAAAMGAPGPAMPPPPQASAPGVQVANRLRAEPEVPRRATVTTGPHGEIRPASESGPPRGVPVPIFPPTPPKLPPSAAPGAPKPAPVAPTLPPNPVRDEYVKTIAKYDGAVLKRLRQIYGLSLEDLAERSKIRRAYLEYIEEENFQFLPAAVYVKGFVTLVASIYGLPAQRVADEYMQIFKTKRP